MKKLPIVSVIAGICFVISGCNSPKLLKCSQDQNGMHFTIKHTAGNRVNPAHYIDTITIAPGSNGVIEYSKIKAENANMGQFKFDGGFIEYREGKWLDVRLLDYSNDFNKYYQYNANGRYSCP